MTPFLNMPFNRRDALAVMGATAATTLGFGAVPTVAAEVDAVPLETAGSNGIPAVSAPLLIAHLAATLDGGHSDAGWRALMQQATELSERYTRDEVFALSADISDRAHAHRCPACFGSGETAIVTGSYPNQERVYPDCVACEGTGRDPATK
jgi:hypothetical protein